MTPKENTQPIGVSRETIGLKTYNPTQNPENSFGYELSSSKFNDYMTEVHHSHVGRILKIINY